MLTEEIICHALHARRVVTLAMFNPHGPLGLEQLAAAAASHCMEARSQPAKDFIAGQVRLDLKER
jgi:hypothetical protein